MSLSHHLQGFFNKEDNTSIQHETSKRSCAELEGAPNTASKPQPKRSDTINSIAVLVKATLGISEHAASPLNRSQPSRPVVLVDRIVLVSICMLVVLGFCVPIIIYALDTDKRAAKITLDIDVDQCISVATYQVRNHDK